MIAARTGSRKVEPLTMFPFWVATMLLKWKFSIRYTANFVLYPPALSVKPISVPGRFFFGNKLCWYVPHDCECKSVRSWLIWFCSQMFCEIYKTRKRLPFINWTEHRKTDIRKINILLMLFLFHFSAIFMENMLHIF